ncbi:unnamed protein product [Prorocentrum cordatum]|uniref:BZIP domain-containing protein n=1 Tax=Prorocentrum cordatum TaxID=2364126 RepID=A0ABN9R6X0_9DINO|nr:unnamed protein product [Polarella glacialis]
MPLEARLRPISRRRHKESSHVIADGAVKLLARLNRRDTVKTAADVKMSEVEKDNEDVENRGGGSSSISVDTMALPAVSSDPAASLPEQKGRRRRREGDDGTDASRGDAELENDPTTESDGEQFDPANWQRQGFNMNKAIGKSTRKMERKVKCLQNDVETIQRWQDEAEVKMSVLQTQFTEFKQGGSSSAA